MKLSICRCGLKIIRSVQKYMELGRQSNEKKIDSGLVCNEKYLKTKI